jgi:hypothetical protein
MFALKCSLLNREYALIDALKVLVSIGFICSLHVIFLSNIYYANIFYIIYKRFVLSIYCKKRLGRSNSMRKIDRLCLVYIDLNVPACGPLRH